MKFAVPFVSLIAATAFAAPLVGSFEGTTASNNIVSTAEVEATTSDFPANSNIFVEKRSIFSTITGIFGGTSGITKIADGVITALGSHFNWSSKTTTIVQTVADDVIQIGLDVAGIFLNKRDLDRTFTSSPFNYDNSTVSTTSTPEREVQKNIMRAYMKAVINENDLDAINDDLNSVLSDLSTLAASKKKRNQL
ncbi:unnamed protein product [Ambrosiozyma monospora]|uniref:Unnamed protein product n=1 Tax=Ambrosiozyma monospora TaxID=43982 RepID=A0ACB5TPJ3_AMBMO|nr:unnamed protein product [Ambrosiozyma monospora]